MSKRGRNIRYRERHADAVVAYQREWRQRNRERVAAYQREWRQRNRERVAAYQREWRRQNRDRVAAYKRAERVKARTLEPERVFVGLDGEGVHVGGERRYVLLGASTGDVIEDWERGLPTVACLDFLWGLAQRAAGRGRIFVWFGSSYDINMIMQDATLDQVWELWTTGETRVPAGQFEYYVRYIPRKIFTINKRKVVGKKRRAMGRAFRSYDVLGFSQQSFVKTLVGWGIIQADSSERAFLTGMKAIRSEFSFSERDRIRDYNALECELLAKLAREIDGLHNMAGFPLASWHGAGATADVLLRTFNVKPHLPSTLGNRARAVVSAYFGGRIQMLRGGFVKKPIYNYDINSAYPHALRMLPSMGDGLGEWRWASDFEPDVWGVWHVSWDLPDAPITPFPFRYRGHVWYPYRGRGWYWQPEVEAAIRHNGYGSHLRVDGGWVWVPATDERPFAFIEELYVERARLKAARDMREKVLKLGMNSIYGKLAQSAMRQPGGRTRLPAWSSFPHAGLTTSITRAALYDAAMDDPENIILFATDGIYSAAPLDLDVGAHLGGWERHGPFELGFFLQPGVYAVLHPDGWRYKSRGFLEREIPWQEIMERWPAFNDWECTVRRFITMGRALQSRALEWPGTWCQWVETTRVLHYPAYDRWWLDAETGRVMFMVPPVDESECYRGKVPGLVDALEGDDDIDEIALEELSVAELMRDLIW